MGYILTMDLNHQRRLVAFLLESDEKEESYFEVFDA